MKKHLLWFGSAFMTAACLMACGDDSGSGSDNTERKIQEYKVTSRLPAECENADVAKVVEDYYACYENEWVKIADSAMVEKIKEGLDEGLLDDIEEFLADMKDKGDSTASSSSGKGSKGKSSSSGTETSSSSAVKDSSSSSSSKESDDEEMCGKEPYDPDTQVCEDGEVLEKCGKRDSYDPETQFCVDDEDVYDKCGGEEYDPETQDCKEGKVVGKCVDATYDLETQVCIEDVVLEKCGEEDGYDPAEQYCKDGTTPTKLPVCGTGTSAKKYNPDENYCDTRAMARLYRTVTIGTQTWMAENMNFETESGSYCYSGTSSNCDTYGRLYTYSAASSACPTGWKLPTQDDYKTLIVEVDTSLHGTYSNTNKAGTLLKSTEKWSGGTAKDTYGFSALPGGYRTTTSPFFYALDSRTEIWTLSLEPYNSSRAYYLSLRYDAEAASISSDPITFGKSVRCIKE